MNERCPACGLRFEREEGYFLGAMYFGYFLATAFMVLAYIAGALLLPWPREWVAGLAVLLFLPLAPLASRFARVLWIHYDRWAWPGPEFSQPPPDPRRNGPA
jgi:hypothetical protein